MINMTIFSVDKLYRRFVCFMILVVTQTLLTAAACAKQKIRKRQKKKKKKKLFPCHWLELPVETFCLQSTLRNCIFLLCKKSYISFNYE